MYIQYVGRPHGMYMLQSIPQCEDKALIKQWLNFIFHLICARPCAECFRYPTPIKTYEVHLFFINIPSNSVMAELRLKEE